VAAIDELARNYRTTVVLCTATQPALEATRADGREGLIGGLLGVREIAPEPSKLYERLRRVTVTRGVLKLDDAALVDELRRQKKVLCIVGTRAHARDLFRALEKEPKTYHLSALMCPAHRSQKLAEIKSAIADGHCRVVATSVVEAGVDIDFPLVWRAIAGLDSIAQAAGRCNREGRLTADEAIVQLFQIEGRRSIPELNPNEEAARQVLRRHHGDPLGPEAIAAYFERLYWRKTQGREDGLDARGILPALNAQATKLWLPFADVARDFRMIETGMEPVIIPWGERARKALSRLADPALPRGEIAKTARKLQPYIVSVPKAAFARLCAAGRTEAVNPHRFEDQFMRLSEEAFASIYSDALGLDWEDATFRSVEALIV
jgi:CRISPR-associated endonuclease/helicase Cas3